MPQLTMTAGSIYFLRQYYPQFSHSAMSLKSRSSFAVVFRRPGLSKSIVLGIVAHWIQQISSWLQMFHKKISPHHGFNEVKHILLHKTKLLFEKSDLIFVPRRLSRHSFTKAFPFSTGTRWLFDL